MVGFVRSEMIIPQGPGSWATRRKLERCAGQVMGRADKQIAAIKDLAANLTEMLSGGQKRNKRVPVARSRALAMEMQVEELGKGYQQTQAEPCCMNRSTHC